MPISHLELKEFLYYDTFVECGSAGGDGIQAALAAGFKEVHSIEINPDNYQVCFKRFLGDTRVNLHFGDCGRLLETVLNYANKPCVIYADANGWVDEKESPFHSSIDAILRNKRKDHTLLVDDINHGFRPTHEVVRDLRRSKEGNNSQDVIKQLLRVNSNYNLYVIDTHSENLQTVYPSWVLVADPNKTRTDVEYI